MEQGESSLLILGLVILALYFIINSFGGSDDD